MDALTLTETTCSKVLAPRRTPVGPQGPWDSGTTLHSPTVSDLMARPRWSPPPSKEGITGRNSLALAHRLSFIPAKAE